jgi:hypothetical protein
MRSIEQIQAVLKKRGYAFFDGGKSFNLNIIGIRSKNSVANSFDDFIHVIYRDEHGVMQNFAMRCTTEPGTYWLKNFDVQDGAAILVPGQYRGTWKLDLHRGEYEALCQRKPVKVYRDGNKDNIIDCVPKTVKEGIYGINIHRAHRTWTLDKVDKYSAGCQVIQNPKDFDKFILLCRQAEILFGNAFTYTLIQEVDFV